MRGFRLLDVLPSSRLILAALDESMPLEVIEHCPACEDPLSVACVLAGTHARMRLGVCEHCGYMGFIDRPTKEWIVNFYSSFWDKDFAKTLTQVKRDAVLSKGAVKNSRRLAIDLYKQLPINKNRPLLDVGCGYGEVLKNFEAEGFVDLVGVENSPQRAQLVREAFGYTVHDGDFGSEYTAQTLKSKAPYGLVFSHHVLEHTFDPVAVIRGISELQQNGDSLILALPNSTAEHILYQGLYLAHLHGFTKESLELLLNRYGYEVRADASPNDTNIILGAVRVANPKLRFALRTDYLARTRKRFASLTKELKPGTIAELVWEQRLESPDWSAIQPRSNLMWPLWWGRHILAYLKSRWFKRVTAGYTMLVQVSKESPDFIISFPKYIKLFLK